MAILEPDLGWRHGIADGGIDGQREPIGSEHNGGVSDQGLRLVHLDQVNPLIPIATAVDPQIVLAPQAVVKAPVRDAERGRQPRHATGLSNEPRVALSSRRAVCQRPGVDASVIIGDLDLNRVPSVQIGIIDVEPHVWVPVALARPPGGPALEVVAQKRVVDRQSQAVGCALGDSVVAAGLDHGVPRVVIDLVEPEGIVPVFGPIPGVGSEGLAQRHPHVGCGLDGHTGVLGGDAGAREIGGVRDLISRDHEYVGMLGQGAPDHPVPVRVARAPWVTVRFPGDGDVGSGIHGPSAHGAIAVLGVVVVREQPSVLESCADASRFIRDSISFPGIAKGGRDICQNGDVWKAGIVKCIAVCAHDLVDVRNPVGGGPSAGEASARRLRDIEGVVHAIVIILGGGLVLAKEARADLDPGQVVANHRSCGYPCGEIVDELGVLGDIGAVQIVEQVPALVVEPHAAIPLPEPGRDRDAAVLAASVGAEGDAHHLVASGVFRHPGQDQLVEAIVVIMARLQHIPAVARVPTDHRVAVCWVQVVGGIVVLDIDAGVGWRIGRKAAGHWVRCTRGADQQEREDDRKG